MRWRGVAWEEAGVPGVAQEEVLNDAKYRRSAGGILVGKFFCRRLHQGTRFFLFGEKASLS